MAQKETYELTSPDGTKVQVQGATRRDTLLARGYTQTQAGGKSSKDSK